MCRPLQAKRIGILLTSAAIAWLTLSTAAHAQVSTATIQGTVSDATGVLPGASVTAREVQSGFTHEATTAGDGTFTLAGLRPGQYQITVAVSQYKPEARTLEVLVGQTVTVNFRITPDLVHAESVTVVGDTRLIDTRKSEVTTNVTQEQLRYLPQNSRNFLNFAALAPGVRVSDNELRKEFSAGALPSQNVNVFVDGVSFKNDVIDGGVVGQDASRGNPFPQNASQRLPGAAATDTPGRRSRSTRTRTWSRTRRSSATLLVSSSRGRSRRRPRTTGGNGVPRSAAPS